MTNFTPVIMRMSAAAATTLLAGCSVGGMFGGGNAAQTQTLQNAIATPAAVAQAQSSTLPAIAIECPPIRVRPGGEVMFYYGNGTTGDPKALQYQGVIDESTRNCVVSNGLITVNMGVIGRVLLGPQGKQTSVNAPIRFAVERDGQAIFSEKYTIPVPIAAPVRSAKFVKVIDNVAIPYLGGEDIVIWVGFDTRG
ncbi:MAG: hypothetical protein MO846_05705 [Candidatus Devosia symbiotica]|nr:hypothetical protein [Candidatus Devosia symbiotica]